MDYTIRRMNQEEYPLLEEFLYQAIYVPEDFEGDIPRSVVRDDPKCRAAYEGFGGRPDDRALVADVDGTVIGACWVRTTDEYGHIDDETPSFSISLFKECRGQGIGTALMQRMLDDLCGAGYARASLSVQKENPALRLYERLGFRIVGEGADESEWLMVSDFRPSTLLIAITGGPCAGKTSSMDALREGLDCLQTPVTFVSEAATELILSGIAPWTCASMLEFQTQVIALQLKHEAAALDRARASGDALVICDRGICDSHAYLSDDDYRLALEANGIDQEQALTRYDAVFHLDSIAKDDAGAYTRENNGARFENAEEAASVNECVISAWSGHPSLRIIGNRPSFHEKTDALFAQIVQLVGAGKLESPILVSACLLGNPCRYDGKAEPCKTVMHMADAHTFVPVCPERLGGLLTPRMPSEIQADGRVVDTAGADRTAAFESGARETLRIAQEHGCKLAILKERSPSCGVHRIYDGTFSGTLVPGKGKTAALLEEGGIKVLSEDDVVSDLR